MFDHSGLWQMLSCGRESELWSLLCVFTDQAEPGSR